MIVRKLHLADNQKLLAQFPNCEQILLLAKDLGADTLTIHRSSTI